MNALKVKATDTITFGKYNGQTFDVLKWILEKETVNYVILFQNIVTNR